MSTTWSRRRGFARSSTSQGSNDPGAIAGWLLARRHRAPRGDAHIALLLIDDIGAIDDADPVTPEPDPVTPEPVAIEGERRASLHRAVQRLSGRRVVFGSARRLVASMLASPEPTTNGSRGCWTCQWAPMGSIGPTRKLALARLREDPNLVRAISS